MKAGAHTELRRNNPGVALIEPPVIITIIVMLATMLLPAFPKPDITASIAGDAADFSTIPVAGAHPQAAIMCPHHGRDLVLRQPLLHLPGAREIIRRGHGGAGRRHHRKKKQRDPAWKCLHDDAAEHDDILSAARKPAQDNFRPVSP